MWVIPWLAAPPTVDATLNMDLSIPFLSRAAQTSPLKTWTKAPLTDMALNCILYEIFSKNWERNLARTFFQDFLLGSGVLAHQGSDGHQGRINGLRDENEKNPKIANKGTRYGSQKMARGSDKKV